MDISQMHEEFRTIGQQVGIQNIRGILPESIDIFLNAAIVDKLRSILMENARTAFPNRVSLQTNSISALNALRTLYKTKVLTNLKDTEYISLNDSSTVFMYTAFSIVYKNKDIFYKCRIIDADKLEETLNDYLNGASWEYPIVSLFAGDGIEYLKLYTNSKSKVPDKLTVKYIEKPAVVKYDDDINNQVDCNLPDYLHHEIVQLAVSKYFQSLAATSQAIAQEQ